MGNVNIILKKNFFLCLFCLVLLQKQTKLIKISNVKTIKIIKSEVSYRSIEGYGLERTFRNIHVQTLCPGKGHLPLVQVAQCPIQPSLEHFQRWNLSGHPHATCSSISPPSQQRKYFLLNISPKYPLCQFGPIPPFSIPTVPDNPSPVSL